MKKLASVLLVLLCLGAWLAAAPPTKKPSAAQIARGKYLVENVGLCRDCHSPRNERGEFIKEQWLHGALLDFQPEHPVPGWTTVTPPLAGLPTYTDAQAVYFLMTGETPAGSSANPPMPQYRFNRADAEAAVAYLRSLPPPPKQ